MLEIGMKYLHFYVILHIYTVSVQGLSVTQSPEKVMYGSPVTITCNIGTITQEVEWFYEESYFFKCSKPYGAGLCHEKNVTVQRHHSYDFNMEKGTAQVKIQSVNKDENDGNWTCKHGSSVVGGIAINVTSKPNVTFTEKNNVENTDIIKEGVEVELECKVNQPVQKITILGSDRESSSNESTSNHSWPIKARCSDHKFRCEASNDYGSVKSKMLTLLVNCPLEVKHDNIETTVVTTVGSNALLVVRYVGYPLPNIVWIRDMGDGKSGQMTSYRNKPEKFHNNATLNIYNVHMEDGGKYTAQLQQGKGQMTYRDFTLVVNEKITSLTNDCGSVGVGVGIGIAVTLVLVAVILGVTWVVLRWRKSKGPANIVVGQEEYENVEYTKEKILNR